MRRIPRWLVLVVVGFAVPLAWLGYQWLVDPDPPGAFYDPPELVAGQASGSVLRSEVIESAGAAAGGGRVWRVLYTSTDAEDRPIAVSAVVIAPSGSAPAQGWPVVAWAHGTTGVASQCAPSLEADGGIARIPVLAELVAAGTVVVATDYPGLGTPGPHPYLVGESEGRAVLDSIRAARALVEGASGTPSAVFGHSQGGHATVFAAQLAPTYAPELEVVGVAAMAPPTDLAQLLERDVNEVDGIVLTALAVDAWSAIYPQADPAAIVHPDARATVEDLGQRCISTTAQGVADLPEVVALRVRFLSAEPSSVPGWSAVLAENSPSIEPIAVPMLVSQGSADDLVRPDVTTSWVDAQCGAGARIAYDTYPGVGHFDLRTVAPPQVLAWLTQRLDGQPVPAGCSRQQVS